MNVYVYGSMCIYGDVSMGVCMYVRVQYTYILTPPLHVLTPNHFPIF